MLKNSVLNFCCQLCLLFENVFIFSMIVFQSGFLKINKQKKEELLIKKKRTNSRRTGNSLTGETTKAQRDAIRLNAINIFGTALIVPRHGRRVVWRGEPKANKKNSNNFFSLINYRRTACTFNKMAKEHFIHHFLLLLRKKSKIKRIDSKTKMKNQKFENENITYTIVIIIIIMIIIIMPKN